MTASDHNTAGDDPDRPGPEREEPPLFQHPPWMVGIVLIFAMIAAVAGLDNPIWWLVGSPFFLVFVIYTWVRFRR